MSATEILDRLFSAVPGRGERFSFSARPELIATGRACALGGDWAGEGRDCSLWHRTAGARRCVDYSFWCADEYEGRYPAVGLRLAGGASAKAAR